MCGKAGRRASEFTLVEMIVAIVIISVGLAGVLLAFGTTVRSSADPMLRKQMLSIAEEMMEEILLKPYSATNRPGTIIGCNRSAADDIGDYAAYASQPVCDIDGVAVAGLEGYAVSVSVEAASLGAVVAGVRKITVHVVRGAESLSLTGWRADYAS